MSGPSLRRVGAIASAAMVAGGIVSWIEYRMLWGGWGTARTIVAPLTADRLDGLCTFVVSQNEAAPLRTAVPFAHACGSDPIASCLEGDTLQQLMGARPVGTSAGLCNSADWPRLWDAIVRHNHAADDDPRAEPVAGSTVEFRTAGRAYAWATYSTREIEDDWHRSTQVVFDMSEPVPAALRASVRRYQIAGLEDTPIWLIWSVNALVLSLALAAAALAAAPFRLVRMVTLVGGIVIAALGLALAAAGLRGVHAHDPWLVVALVTATLMCVTGGALGSAAWKQMKRAAMRSH